MTTPIDFLVIGGGEAAYCAAAIAASNGARVAMVELGASDRLDDTSQFGFTMSDVPNSVWRRLELQKYNLALEPASAMTTLLPDNKNLSYYASDQQTVEALRAHGNGDDAFWSDFLSDMQLLAVDPAFRALAAMEVRSEKNTDALRAETIAGLVGNAHDFLRSYFSDEKLLAHILAHVPSANGVDSPGSALAVPGLFNKTAWPQKVSGDVTLARAFRNAGEAADVDYTDAAIVSIEPRHRNRRTVTLATGDIYKARTIYIASPDTALQLGISASSSPLASTAFRRASLTLKINDTIDPPGGDRDALFQIVDDADDLQCAYEAASLGRLPETPPLRFRFVDHQTIVAQCMHCPTALAEDGVERDWTSQDRQALAMAMIARLESRMPGLQQSIVERQFSLSPIGDVETSISVDDNEGIIVQPYWRDTIALTEELVDRALGHD